MWRHRMFVALALGVIGVHTSAAQSHAIPAKVLAISETPNGVLLAGTEGNGVFVSRDSGKSWSAAGLEGKDVAGVAQIGTNTWFAGVRSFLAGGLFVSTDQGAQWRRVGNSRKIQAMSVVRADSNWSLLTGLAGGGPAVIDDKGDWRGGAGIACANIDAVTTLRDGTLFAGGECGLLRSDGDAKKWSRLGDALRGSDVRALASAETPETTILLAGTVNGVFESTDRGASWQSVSSGLPSLSVRSVSVDTTGTEWAATDAGPAVRVRGASAWVGLGGMTGRARFVHASQSGGIFVQGDDRQTIRLDREPVVQHALSAGNEAERAGRRQTPGEAQREALTPEVPKGSRMTNDDVVKLVAAGLSEQVIATAIRQERATAFDLTPTGLIALKGAHVPDAVILAMQQREITAPATVTNEPKAPPKYDPMLADPAKADAAQNRCAGIESMGLYKNEVFSAAMGGGVVEWLVKIRNNSAVTKIVVIGWRDMYGQQKNAQIQLRGGEIASPRLDMTQARVIPPVADVRILSCQ